MVNDLVVEREKLSLNMQPQKKSQKVVGNHNWRSREDTEWKIPLKQRPPGGGNLEPDGQREYIQLYL